MALSHARSGRGSCRGVVTPVSGSIASRFTASAKIRKTLTAALDYATRKECVPKSANSAAPLPMPELLVQHLRSWIEKHYRQNPDGYLFINSNGRPYLSDRVVGQGIHKTMAKLGITRPERGQHAGIHAFRHGVTSELLQAGTPIHLVTRMMRHADSKVTLDHYAHVIGDAERAASEKLSQRIGAQLEPDPQLEPNSAAKTA